MTIAKDFASKAAIAFVALAMALSMFAPAAQAQSSEDLQKMINDLLAQIASLQSQVGQGGTSVASGICPYTWTRDLNVGATGADVMKLQQSLNADQDTRVSASGAGSVGAETEYFGPATAAAVSKFQVKYRSEILSPAGLVNPTGYFGPSSRAKMNSICSAPVVVPPVVVPGDEDEDTTDEEDEDMGELQGEGVIDDVAFEAASDEQVEEGAEDAEIALVTFEAVDGDVSISRMDIAIDGGATDAWDVLDTVSLWIDGDMVAEMDASDEDEYQSDDVTLRFSGLDIVVPEDEEVEIVIAASIAGNVDTSDLGDYNVSVDTVRYFDADGVATTEDGTDHADLDSNEVFEIVEAGDDDELIVKTSTSDLDGTTLQVEDDSKSDFMPVFVFDLDTDDSVNDIELNEVAVTVVISTGTYATVIDDAELVIDGVTIDDFTASTSVNGLVTDLVFDVDGDVTIDAGDRVAAELRLKFQSLDVEGTTVQGKVTSAQASAIVAEGADDLDNTSPDQLTGSATGDVHTLRTAGIDVELDSVDADVTVNDSATDDYATYVIKVDVTAFEQDVFVAIDDAVSFLTSLEESDGTPVTVGTSTANLTSTADEQGAYYLVNEGETETFTLTVTFTPGAANTEARVQLDSIEFAATEAAPNQSWTASPDTDYRTAVVTIVN